MLKKTWLTLLSHSEVTDPNTFSFFDNSPDGRLTTIKKIKEDYAIIICAPVSYFSSPYNPHMVGTGVSAGEGMIWR